MCIREGGSLTKVRRALRARGVCVHVSGFMLLASLFSVTKERRAWVLPDYPLVSLNHTHIMIQLKPEIYRLIVNALISPDDETNITSTPNAKQPPIASHSPTMMIGKDQQASLATLMRVSNVSTWLLWLIPD
jgi:hypothetical protein